MPNTGLNLYGSQLIFQCSLCLFNLLLQCLIRLALTAQYLTRLVQSYKMYFNLDVVGFSYITDSGRPGMLL